MSCAVIAGFAALAGLAVGWWGRRRTWTWCSRCGGAVGTVCIHCNDRDRIINLTRADMATRPVGKPRRVRVGGVGRPEAVAR